MQCPARPSLPRSSWWLGSLASMNLIAGLELVLTQNSVLPTDSALLDTLATYRAQGLLLRRFTGQDAAGFEAVIISQDPAGGLHHSTSA